MDYVKLAFRRIFRHWSLYLFTLIGISLISGLLAGLPVYSQAITYHSLRTTLAEGHPIDRNFEVVGSTSVLTSGLWGLVNELIGDLIVKRLEIRTTQLGVNYQNPIITIEDKDIIKPNSLTVLSLDKMKSNAFLVEGDWPEFAPPSTREEIMSAMRKPPDIEAAIGVNAAQELGIKIGDIVIDYSGRHFPIIGLISPSDPEDDIWWGNTSIFGLSRKPGINEDTISITLIIHQNSLREYFPMHEASWRILVNNELITPDEVLSIEQRIINFKSRIEVNRASLITNLPNLLMKYREDITITRMVVVLLSMQAFIFMLYSLYLVEALILERAKAELATMVGRGSGPLQLVLMIGTEGLILSFVSGAFIGPLLVKTSFLLLSRIMGWSFSLSIERDVYLLSMLGAGIGWLVLLIGTISISRRNVLSWKKHQSRIEEQPIWQKYYFDVILLAFSGIIYWQLSYSGSFVHRRLNDTDLADPLLLISPTLFLLSISLFLLRIYPILLGFLSLMFRKSRGLIFPLNFMRLSRNAQRPSQMILLISIAAGVTLFSSSYDYSLSVNQQRVSHYISGADIRISQNNLSIDDIAKYPGVLNVTQVYRHVSQLRTGNTVTILGIDPSSITKVVTYPHGMTNITIQDIANVLDTQIANVPYNHESQAQINGREYSNLPLPAIFSFKSIPSNLGIGDQQELTIFSIPIEFTIRGLIQNFPTCGSAYILTNLPALSDEINLVRSEYRKDFELWLSVNPEKYPEIISTPEIQDYLISDAQQELMVLQDNAFTQGVMGAFELNTFILTITSTITFSLLIYSSTSDRKYEFGILRTAGLSSKQIIKMLLIDGIIIIFIGISIGTLVGFGLLAIMRPYLNVALMRALPQMLVYEILINWREIAVRYGILLSAYLSSLGLATWILIRIGIHQVMRIGDE